LTETPPAEPPAASEAPSPDESRPTRMTAKERQYGLILAVLCLAGIAGPWLPKAASGDSKAAWLTVASSVLAMVLAAASRRGHRVVATFAAVAAGFPTPRYVAAFPIQLACLVYGGWLMLSTNRAVRRQSLAGGRSPADRAKARREAKAARGGRRRRPSEAAPTTTRQPARSKRYTPPQKKR
jgi:hypothetical protein